MVEENWRDVPGCPGYRVSDHGRVIGARGRVLSPAVSGAYLIVNLGKRHGTRRVHRLVLEAFVGPRPSGMQCRHLDGNGTNNQLGNLTWGTDAENLDDKRRHSLARVPPPLAVVAQPMLFVARELAKDGAR